MRLVECVPNFSEGRDRAVIDAIADAIRGTEGVSLLDVDPGQATNRTVYTFVGAPESAAEAAFRAIEVAARRIDMTRHRGEHPRIGAADVVPFVPLQGTTMDDCVALAKQLGRRVGDELGIPVYLYQNAAANPKRRELPDVRAGEYEGLAARLRDPEWRPDFGPATFNARSGATWLSLGALIFGSPVPVVTGLESLDVFVRGADFGIWRKTWSNGQWLPAGTEWEDLGRNI